MTCTTWQNPCHSKCKHRREQRKTTLHYSAVLHSPSSRHGDEHGRHAPIGSWHGRGPKGSNTGGPSQRGPVVETRPQTPGPPWGHTPSSWTERQGPLPSRGHGVGVHGVVGHPRGVAWVRPVPAPSPLPPVVVVPPVVAPPPSPPVAPGVHQVPPPVRVGAACNAAPIERKDERSVRGRVRGRGSDTKGETARDVRGRASRSTCH